MIDQQQNLENTQEASPAVVSRLVNSSVKWVVAGVVGLTTGVAKFITDVRSEFYDNVIRGPDFKTKLEAHGEKLGHIKNQRRSGITDTEEFISQFKRQKDKFAKATDAFAQELGIESSGFRGWTKGTGQRYRTLSQNSRLPLIFSAGATTVIGFAGTSMFLNSLANRKQLKEIAEHPAEQHDTGRS